MMTDNADWKEQTEKGDTSKEEQSRSFTSDLAGSVEMQASERSDDEVFYRGGTASAAPGRPLGLHPSRPMTGLARVPRRFWIVLGSAMSLVAAILFAGSLAIGTSINVIVVILGGIGLLLASLIALYLGILLGNTANGVVEPSPNQ